MADEPPADPPRADAPTADERLRRADESMAPHFTRIMRASTSLLGVLTDPPLIGVVEAVLIITCVSLYSAGILGQAQLPILYGLLALPILVGVAVDLTLRSARARVVAWLSSLPFPIENMNGLMNGVAQNLVVRFAGEPPPRDKLNAELDKISPDCFALEYDKHEPEVQVRIGVLDSKVNPTTANYHRYLRVQALVEQALGPLSGEYPIERVRIC